MKRAVVLIIWAFAVVACALASRSRAQTASVAATQPTTAPVSAFAPIAYFEQNCARCHGPYGSAYGPTFGQNLSGDQLTKVCDDMAAGPGNAPVKEDELKILVDYHKALIAKRPFVAITKVTVANDTATLEGEVTPDTKVSVNGQQATVDRTVWHISMPTAKTYTIEAVSPAATTRVSIEQ